MLNLRQLIHILHKNIGSKEWKNINLARDVIFNQKFIYGSLNKLNYSTSPVMLSSKFKIYTKTGDKGSSSLFTGERRPKNDAIFDALGNTDELNSNLGLAREFCLELKNKNSQLIKTCDDIELKIVKIQSTLLDVGSFIATPRTKAKEQHLNRLSSFDSNLTKELETWIDTFELELKPLTNFILPGGGKTASLLHVSRSVCRRLERSLQPLLKSNDLDPNVQIYVNRLSDFLFVCARYISMKEEKKETIYKKV